MNIAVYCGSRDGLNPKTHAFVDELGAYFVKSGHHLVYGGGNCGLMGRIAHAVLDRGGLVYGVIPTFLVEREASLESVTELTVVEDMPTRKTLMINKSEACVVLPGGVGTLEEVSEILSMLRLDLTERPCFIVNIDGFYDPLKALLDNMVDQDFMEEPVPRVYFVETVDEIDAILRSLDR